MAKKRTLRKKRFFLVVGIVLISLINIGLFYYLSLPMVELKGKTADIEINSTVDASQYIKNVHKCHREDVVIDASQVNVNQLGKYEISYKVKNKEYYFNINVVDSKAPTFKVNDVDIDVGQDINVNDVVFDIEDETKTKVYWKEKYDFSKEGSYNATIIVEDEGGNKTEKIVKVNIVKDEEKPILEGLKDFVVEENQNIDYLAHVSAKDNRDPSPVVQVDSSQVQLDKAGTYKVIYTVKDRSGNENQYTQKVTVKAKEIVQKPSITVPANGNKIVYLTFDDGPSANTQKILNILGKYSAKATFFVTGNGQKYNYLIKDAYQKGHTIGLHTYTHDYAKVYASVDAYFADLNRIGQMVKNQIGFVPHYIRFPGGSSNAVSKKYCTGIMSTLVNEVQNRGYQYYDWNVSSDDATGNNVPVSTIVRSSTSSNANNIMILMHDTQAKSTTVEALPQIIEYYQSQGYVFKGIDDSSFTPHHHVNN